MNEHAYKAIDLYDKIFDILYNDNNSERDS